MQDAINAVKSLAYKKFIDIDMECPNEQAIIFANEKYLFQVLLNLLSNSIKFTEPKGRVYIGVKPKAEFVEIYITDTGRGIPKEKIDSIFDAFVQAAEGDEGTGLGLKIVKEMCESMNIDIKLESEVGIGTTFRLFARRF
jgi:signal transduction histidine kinase